MHIMQKGGTREKIKQDGSGVGERVTAEGESKVKRVEETPGCMVVDDRTGGGCVCVD